MSRDEPSGLEALYRDVVDADLPDPELLARYATAPNGLSAEERQTVEQAMARSRAVADELDTLRSFDFRRLDADRAGAAEAGVVGRVLAWLQQPLVATSLVAAVALALWLALGTEQGDPVDESSAPRLVETPTGETPSTVPAPVEPSEAETLPLPERDAGRLAEAGGVPRDESAPRSPEEPDPSRAEGSAELQLAEERPADTPRPREAAPPTEATGAPDPPEGLAEPSERRPEILLAMLEPRYVTPLGSPTRSLGPSTFRSAPNGAARIVPLAPPHVAHTAEASPTLYWHVDPVPTSGGFHLTLSDDRGEDVVENRRLTPVDGPGIQSTRLADLGVVLEPGREYRWSIAHRLDPDAPPTAYVFGWILRVEPDRATREALAGAEVGERPALLAEAGLWYDAIHRAAELADRYPDDPRPREALRALLDQGGVPTLEDRPDP